MPTKTRPQDGLHQILKPIIYRGAGKREILRPSGDKNKPNVATFGHIADDLDYQILIKTGVIKPVGGK